MLLLPRTQSRRLTRHISLCCPHASIQTTTQRTPSSVASRLLASSGGGLQAILSKHYRFKSGRSTLLLQRPPHLDPSQTLFMSQPSISLFFYAGRGHAACRSADHNCLPPPLKCQEMSEPRPGTPVGQKASLSVRVPLTPFVIYSM
ncbi:hypothetical protein EJ05DRAFT_344401 [Pseudovirgaria hyperparasitica]|uniref:Uncharacterized protein n=1 Tax=Pseudovirgaria hyperparasitica TaxID=470096 RepID=A0A6A6W960_9PEZI|nr:uncharacterized protein EJ05DRAFT_344401 [Pseudovirgaria hyperparasitica]KAF2759382.1 hypothetical protein EJ05DRAFT_344401 [Pseudovirgaria hyperparasitica]